MTKVNPIYPYLAYSDLTNRIYIVRGKATYKIDVTDLAIELSKKSLIGDILETDIIARGGVRDNYEKYIYGDCKCGMVLGEYDKYCRRCGIKIKWIYDNKSI